MGSGDIPRMGVVRNRQLPRGRSKPYMHKWMAPFAVLFALSGFCYTCWWNDKRSKEGPCIDCKRQKEIMDEIYFNKHPVSKGSRL
uniref:Transmembrane protein n=1 Tax=Trypanosoma vivax (strain Y486) TaxID=1055687 RepID=G0U775_TRYVY|nr:conserved hypothetical protein [Trypanosoma vivax Y486]